MTSNVNLIYDRIGDEEPGVRVGLKTQSLPYSVYISSILRAPCHHAKALLFIRFLLCWDPEAPQGINTGHLQSHHVSYPPVGEQNWRPLNQI